MGIRPPLSFVNVKPKLDSGYKNIGLVAPVETSKNVTALGLPMTPAPTQGSGGDQWKEFSINLSIGDMISEADLKNFTEFLKGVDKVSKGLVALIKILRLLTSDLFDLNRAFKFVITLIVMQLKDLINSFLSTGIYVTVVKPQNGPYDKAGYTFPTWGNFEEFKTVLVSACNDRSDIGSPSQFGIGTKVGGFVIGAAIGTNDVRVVDNIYTNFKIIGDLFGFDFPLPSPPKSAKAVGILVNTKSGVKISWDAPDSTIFGGFRVYRSTTKEGSPPTPEEMDAIIQNSSKAKDPTQVRNFQQIKLYNNDGFNSGKPLFVPPGLAKYTIVDFEVKPGVTYYYKIYTVLGIDSGLAADPYVFRLDSPLASNMASAVAGGCIPTSEIPRGILTTSGEWIDEHELQYRNSRWTQINLDRFLGPQVDKLFKVIDNFADKLIGFVSTGSDAMGEFLDFFANKISDYIKIIQTITNIINIIMNFRLKGSLLFLDLTNPKLGGIQGFSDRIGRATVNSSIFGKRPKSSSEVISSVLTKNTTLTQAMSDDAGQSLSALQGIYVGIVVVYGFLDPTDPHFLDAYAAPYMEEYNDVKKQIDDSSKSIDLLLKILLGKGT